LVDADFRVRELSCSQYDGQTDRQTDRTIALLRRRSLGGVAIRAFTIATDSKLTDVDTHKQNVDEDNNERD